MSRGQTIPMKRSGAPCECLALYFNVDNITIDRDSFSRLADGMIERDIILLEELKFEIGMVQAKGKLIIRQLCYFISDNWSLPSALGCQSFLSWASKHRIVDRYALCLYEDQGTCPALLAFATAPFWSGNIQIARIQSIAQTLSRFCVSSFVFYRQEYRKPQHRNYSA